MTQSLTLGARAQCLPPPPLGYAGLPCPALPCPALPTPPMVHRYVHRYFPSLRLSRAVARLGVGDVFVEQEAAAFGIRVTQIDARAHTASVAFVQCEPGVTGVRVAARRIVVEAGALGGASLSASVLNGNLNWFVAGGGVRDSGDLDWELNSLSPCTRHARNAAQAPRTPTHWPIHILALTQ